MDGNAQNSESVFDRISKVLEDFEATPESVGYELQGQFARIINVALRSKGWTQRKLAQTTGKRESEISELVHGDVNCRLDTMGRIMFALNLKLFLVPAAADYPRAFGEVQDTLIGHWHGEEEDREKTERETHSNGRFEKEVTTAIPANGVHPRLTTADGSDRLDTFHFADRSSGLSNFNVPELPGRSAKAG